MKFTPSVIHGHYDQAGGRRWFYHMEKMVPRGSKIDGTGGRICFRESEPPTERAAENAPWPDRQTGTLLQLERAPRH